MINRLLPAPMGAIELASHGSNRESTSFQRKPGKENPETRSQPLNSCQPENESVYTVLILVPEDLRDACESALWIWECSADHKQHAIDQSLEEVYRAFSQDDPDDFEVYGVVLGRLEFL